MTQSASQQSNRQGAHRTSQGSGPLKLKTYRAWTMSEALATVKQDLGHDAVILHTRTFERGGIFGIGRRTVVELTAARAADLPAEPAPADMPAATPSRLAQAEPRESLRMSAAARAYGSQPARASGGTGAGTGTGTGTGTGAGDAPLDLEVEREKTRRLAQAMSIQLEKQASAREAASQNERATAQSSAGSPAPKPAASTPAQPAPSQRVPSHPLPAAEPVAQRFVLVAQPAAGGTKPNTIVQLVSGTPKPTPAPVAIQQPAPKPHVELKPTPAPAAPIEVGMAAFVPTEFLAESMLPEPKAQPLAQPLAQSLAQSGAQPSAELKSEQPPEQNPEQNPEPAQEPLAEHAPAISIAAPLSFAAPASTLPARSRAVERESSAGTSELTAISDFVGRVLEGRSAAAPHAASAREVVVDAAPAAVPSFAEVRVPESSGVPGRPELPQRPEVLERAYSRLIEQEVATELADRIVASVESELQSAIDAGAVPSETVVREAVERRIAALLPADAEDGLGGARLLPGKFGARRIAFVGPTGVGKTTTLAKIAAQLKLKRGLSVGIVAADTYRIAAVDQLRTYAEILEVPVEVAASPADAERACQRLDAEHGVDVILLDTAGRSQNDRMKLSELRAFLAASRPDETHLVLSATAGARTLEREAAAFGAVGIDRIVLTKLDEAATFGTLISLVERLGKRVSFLTHGQEVPDHIEPGRGRRLAELVMGSEVR